jgi:ATP-dependent Clp protease ATP-binding subunit ClpC
MILTVPIYLQRHGADGSFPRYTARPLFFGRPVQSGPDLGRVLNQLAVELRLELHTLGKEYRHDELARWSFCPDLDHHRLDLTLELKHQRVKCTFLFVSFEALGRRVAFSPSLPEIWFDLRRGERLVDRATEVLTAHFRAQEKEEEDAFESPAELSLEGKAWVTTLDVQIEPAQLLERPQDSLRAMLGGAEVLDGEAELRRVGRCLDLLHPDGLNRALLREREVAELTRLLEARDRRPVLLLGPRQVGKTTLVHECVCHAVAARGHEFRFEENTYLLSPQRLISGMSYVGQWQQRLLAILAEVKKRDHVVYVDDLLGLYQAGISRDVNLSVAHVLKPFVERREVRFLGEITSEGFRVLREQDRGFADLFHLLPVREPGDDDNLRILVSVMRELEGRHRCRFDLEVLPAVLDLQRRYVRDAAFPGKAASFLERLAVKCRRREVTRETVLDEFRAQSGLAVAFLDSRSRLERQEVLAALGREVIGQRAALEAAADVIAVAKARLNDPDRPLASFLFLGPTGVGKTQCAKALAAYLFGEADKITRFDMNEFIEAGSAARLVGTFANPEGLLTAALRRRPFAVLLLDEIEKAHPEVHDLLLQVLGEGRLTDALGRVVDFGNCIIILTSNLGVRAVENRLGYDPDSLPPLAPEGRGAGGEGESPSPGVATPGLPRAIPSPPTALPRGEKGESSRRAAYLSAAEKFFRPEFFNRLDRVVPFERLDRADVEKIARLLIRDVFNREGLLRRKCVLCVEAEAMARVVDLGHDPVLGARALKRAVERHLAQPVAVRLAAGIPEALTVVNLYPGKELIDVSVQVLEEVRPHPAPTLPPDRAGTLALLDTVAAALHRIEERFAHLRPEGPITLTSLRPEHDRYFAIQGQARRVRDSMTELREEVESYSTSERLGPAYPVAGQPRQSSTKMERLCYHLSTAGPVRHNLLAALAATLDIHAYLQDLVAGGRPVGDRPEDRLAVLLRQLALLQVIADCCERQAGEQALLLVRAVNPGPGGWVGPLAAAYRDAYGAELGLDAELLFSGVAAPPDVEATRKAGPSSLPTREQQDATLAAVVVKGPHALPLAAVEEGTHLFCPAHEGVQPVQVTVLPVAEGQEPLAVLHAHLDERRRWLEQLVKGQAAADDDPFWLGPVLRVYDHEGSVLDLRSGLAVPMTRVDEYLRTFILAALPLPPELLQASDA